MEERKKMMLKGMMATMLSALVDVAAQNFVNSSILRITMSRLSGIIEPI